MSALKLLAKSCPRFPKLKRCETPEKVREWSRIAFYCRETECTVAEAMRTFRASRSKVETALRKFGPAAATVRLAIAEAGRQEKGGAA